MAGGVFNVTAEVGVGARIWGRGQLPLNVRTIQQVLAKLQA